MYELMYRRKEHMNINKKFQKYYLIIIPTYNEKENIENLIIKINSILSGKECKFSILIVDDNSPDGTAEIVKELMKKFENLYLIERNGKLGLGTAYIEGFKWGLKNGYDYLIEMDADFSHDPVYLLDMIDFSSKYDFVIGSRYVKGGGVEGWGFLRKFISNGGSLYSRIILNCPIKDFTGGFNLWSKTVLKSINLDNIFSNGYSFQIELKYRSFKKGFKFYEFPIVFKDRTFGKSKMSKKIFIEAVFNVWKFRFKIK